MLNVIRNLSIDEQNSEGSLRGCRGYTDMAEADSRVKAVQATTSQSTTRKHFTRDRSEFFLDLLDAIEKGNPCEGS